jgi:hypothetical protein
MFTRSASSHRRYQAAVCGIVFALCGAAAKAQVFSQPQPQGISNSTRNSSYPAMVADAAGNIDVAWVDSTSGINFSRSTNSGASFSAAVTIPSSAGAAFQPQMVVDPTGTIVEIAWAKPSTAAGAPQNSFDVFVSRWTSAVPLAFTSVQVSLPTAPALLVDAPRLAFVGTGLDVVWGSRGSWGSSGTWINSGTWISTSPNGLTFSAPITLSTAAQDSGGPRIAVDKSGNIFVAWTDKLAEDLGTAGNYCTNPTPITDNNGNVTGYSNTSGGNYYLNWTKAGTTGTTPSAANTRSLSSTDWKNVNLDPAYPNGYFGCSYDNLQLFFDANGNLHLLWGDEAPLEDLLTSVATTPTAPNGSPTFTFPMGTSGEEGVGSPWAATDSSGRTYVVYASGPKAPATAEGIYFNRSDDGKSFYFPESRVLSAPGAISPAYPQVAVDTAGNVNVVWEQPDQQITANGGNTFHLFFTRSTDKGVTFPTITPVFPLTGNSSVLCISATTSGATPPTTPDTTTCGTVQMGVDANSDPDIAWVNNPGSAGSMANIDFAIGNMTVPPPNDFSISVSPGTPTAYAGQTVPFTVNAQVANGTFNSPITLGCNDFIAVASTQGGTIERPDYVCTPSGPLNVGGSATITLAIPPGLPSSVGTNQSPYPFAISGTSGGMTHRVMVAFNSAGPAGSVSPSSASLSVGASQTFNVTLNPGPFNANVNLQCLGQPAWIQCAFNPQSVAASSSPVTSTLTVTVTSAPNGSVLSYPSATSSTPIQRWHLLLSATLAALYFVALTMMWIWQRDRLSASLVLRRCAIVTLMLVLSIGLVSCGGAANPSSSSAAAISSSNVSGGGTGGSGGSSGGGSSTPVTATFNVQAQSGKTTAVLGTISITTP